MIAFWIRLLNTDYFIVSFHICGNDLRCYSNNYIHIFPFPIHNSQFTHIKYMTVSESPKGTSASTGICDEKC